MISSPLFSKKVILPTVFLMIVGFLVAFISEKPLEAQTKGPIFSDLSLGSGGPEVIALQKILNRDPETQVAQTGPGSPGQESGYYGSLTSSAVSRFQTKYFDDVLAPVNLTAGTGRVGSFTRAKLNILASNYSPIPVSPTNQTTNQPLDFEVTENERIDIYATDAKINKIQEEVYAAVNLAVSRGKAPSLNGFKDETIGKVILQDLSTNQGSTGTTILLTASGYSQNIRVYFGPKFIVRSVKQQLGFLSVSVPPLPAGRYDVVLKSDEGVSNSLPFVITSPAVSRVVIDSITPAEIKFGDSLTIHGSGFSKTGNEVVLETHKIKDVESPDGKTITIPIAPESIRESAKGGDGKNKLPIGIRVISQHGISNSVQFILTI